MSANRKGLHWLWGRGRPQSLWMTLCLLLVANWSEGRDDAMSGDGFVLDLTRLQVTQAIGPELDAAAPHKFVQIEVAEVHNPKRLRLTFEVRYRRGTDEAIPLGSFALFPPDNPGTFLIATRGEVRNEGAIVLTMRVLDANTPEDQLSVRVKPFVFR